MDKETNIANDGFSHESSATAKVIAILLAVAGVLYVLAQCVRDGLWFVALGVIALAVCAAFGVLLIYLSNRLARRKAFDVTVEKPER
ncbi:MAG: hypothetical protein ACERKO_02620 [Acetanaerobacterium sp.]